VKRILLVMAAALIMAAMLAASAPVAFAGSLFHTGPCRWQFIGNPGGKNGAHFEALEDRAPGQIKHCPDD
jgi:hypothetical protein